MAVWRLQLKTGADNATDISKYCIDNHVAAMGWSLSNLPDNEVEGIATFDDYCKLARVAYEGKRFDSVYRLANSVKPGDIIWIRSEGKYYYARVRDDSAWRYCADKEIRILDASNQRINMFWHPATEHADESSVPGAVATSFIMGSTLQRINKPGIEEYSQMLFNHRKDRVNDEYTYPPVKLELNEKNFYSLIGTDDAEDLLCLWLYRKKGYIVIPSTNKIATKKYECVLIDPSGKDGKHIYIQVKKGDVDLDASDYRDLNGEVYLLTTGGSVSGEAENVKTVDPVEIFEFATDPENENLIPENIYFWIKFLTDCENEGKNESDVKGIMFDTNKSYSETNEDEMLADGMICAYGAAKRYIRSFHHGDYALYYSKGKGIIAVGKIKDGKVREIEDGLGMDVDMIVPAPGREIEKNLYLSAEEIKGILKRGFYFASTIKTPFLTEKQVRLLLNVLREKYIENGKE